MKEYKNMDTNNITFHYDEGVDEKTTVIRAIEYEGEVWYNAKDIENHLKSVIDGMVEVKGYAEKLNDTIKKHLK